MNAEHANPQTLIRQGAHSSPVHDPGQKLCMNHEGTRENGIALSHVRVTRCDPPKATSVLFSSLLHTKNGYFSARNPGGLGFENSMSKSTTVSPWVQDSAGISLTFTHIREGFRKMKGSVYIWFRAKV